MATQPRSSGGSGFEFMAETFSFVPRLSCCEPSRPLSKPLLRSRAFGPLVFYSQLVRASLPIAHCQSHNDHHCRFYPASVTVRASDQDAP